MKIPSEFYPAASLMLITGDSDANTGQKSSENSLHKLYMNK